MGQDPRLQVSGWRRRALSIGVAVTAIATVTSASLLAGDTLRQCAPLERFLGPEAAPLRSYRALRRLMASTRGGRMEATIIAWTELDPARGFRYQVVSRSGSAAVQNRALIPALEMEAHSLAPGDSGRAALTRANYRFAEAAETEGGLLRIAVTPYREAPMLLDGAMYLRPDTGDLVRVEGRLVKRPSFWTRRVDIVRHYMRLAGVRVPVGMESVGQVLVLGPSSFTMTWEYESVNGIRVGTPGARAVAATN